MVISCSCPKCLRVIYAPSASAGTDMCCPGCGQTIVVPTASSLGNKRPVTRSCPQCSSELRLMEQLTGKHVRCNACDTILKVLADVEGLTVVRRDVVPTIATASPKAGEQPSNKAPSPPPLPPQSQAIQKSLQVCETNSRKTKVKPPEDDLLQFRCPRCSGLLQIPKECAGTKVSCSCSCKVQVPGLSVPPCVEGELPVNDPPTALGLFSLLGAITVLAFLSSFLGTLLAGHS